MWQRLSTSSLRGKRRDKGGRSDNLARCGAQAESGVHHSALQARAIWLVGICNGKMSPELWGETLSLVVQNMANPDLVVALTSVSALVGLISFLLEEEAVSAAELSRNRSDLNPSDLGLKSSAIVFRLTCP